MGDTAPARNEHGRRLRGGVRGEHETEEEEDLIGGPALSAEQGEEAWRGVWLGQRVRLGRCRAGGAEDGPARLRPERGGERERLASRPRKAGQPATVGRISGKEEKKYFSIF